MLVKEGTFFSAGASTVAEPPCSSGSPKQQLTDIPEGRAAGQVMLLLASFGLGLEHWESGTNVQAGLTASVNPFWKHLLQTHPKGLLSDSTVRLTMGVSRLMKYNQTLIYNDHETFV